eukprot:XP_025002604.1 uncharacterized protein LOC112531576 [Gallus gallus]
MHRNGCESGIDTQPPHTLGAGNITLNTAPSPLAAAKPAAAPIGPGPSIVLTRELRRLGAARDTSLRIERARKYKSEWREPGGGGMQSSEAAARRRTANRERRGPPPPARRRRGPRAPEAAPRPLRGAPAHGPRGSAERDAAPRAFARLFRSAAAPSAAPLPGGGRPGGGAGCRGVPAPARRRAAPRPAAALTRPSREPGAGSDSCGGISSLGAGCLPPGAARRRSRRRRRSVIPRGWEGARGVSERPPRRLQRRPKTQPAGPELTEQPPAVPAPRCPALVAAVRCAGPPRGRSARCHQLQRCEQPAARAGIG